MAQVTRKYTCKNCEETFRISFSQEELREKIAQNEAPKCKEDYLLLYGVCEACFDDKIV